MLATAVAPAKRVVTEDLGKIAEYALCLVFGTPFGGKYKYAVSDAEKLRDRFAGVAPLLGGGWRHTGATDKLYDFRTDAGAGLSLKTTKDGSWKICPQLIGQPTRKRFCEAFGLDAGTDNAAIKAHIEASLPALLSRYVDNTFHCPLLFYDRASDACLLIRKREPVDWDTVSLEMSHLAAGKPWGESSTVKGGTKRPRGTTRPSRSLLDVSPPQAGMIDVPAAPDPLGHLLSVLDTSFPEVGIPFVPEEDGAPSNRPITIGDVPARSSADVNGPVVGDRPITIGEFQVHNHRSCIKFRFHLQNLLKLFPTAFEVQKVPAQPFPQTLSQGPPPAPLA